MQRLAVSAVLFAAAALIVLGFSLAARADDVQDLVRDLGSDDFKTREAATHALAARGPEALDALRKASASADPEVRWRAEKAIREIEARHPSAAQKPPPHSIEVPDAPVPFPVPPEPREFVPEARPEPLPFPSPDELERELEALEPQVRELMRQFELDKLFPREFADVFEELQRRFRELEDPDRDGWQRLPGPGGPEDEDEGAEDPFRDFQIFRFKDGRWSIDRGDRRDGLARRVGVKAEPTGPALRAQLGLPDPPGVVLDEVEPGSLADRAGLAQYDIILEVDGKPVARPNDLRVLADPGDHALKVVRGGERRAISLSTPAPKPIRGGKAKPREEIRKY